MDHLESAYRRLTEDEPDVEVSGIIAKEAVIDLRNTRTIKVSFESDE
jgi:hypothetical protein